MAEQIIWKQEKENIGGLQWLLRGGLVCIAYLLFAKSTMGLTGHLFSFKEVSGSEKYGVLLVISTMAIALWNGKVACMGQRKKQFWGNGLFLVGWAFLLFVIYRGLGEELKEGLQGLSNTYMARWEAHSSKFIPMNTGSVFAMRTVTELLLLSIIPLLQIAGAMERKNKWALGLPIAIICAGLLAVFSPQWKDLVYLGISSVLFFYLDSCDRIEGKSLLGLSVGFLLFLSIPGMFQEKVADWVVDWNGDLFCFQERLEDRIRSGNLLKGLSKKDLVDNYAPEFEDKEVIQLKMSGKPQKNIYLRGYHCQDYEKGLWEKPKEAFQVACEEQGIQEAVASEQLLSIPYQSEDLPGNDKFLYELSYTGLRDKYTYFPYGVGWAEDPKEYQFSGDSIVRKAKGSKNAKVLSWKELRYLDEKPIVGYFSNEDGTKSEDMWVKSTFMSGYDPENLSKEDEKLFDWYSDFVHDNYLRVPDYMENVKHLAEKIYASVAFQVFLWNLNTMESDVATRNAARLEIAHLVANLLKNQGSYSWELDRLPKGEDVVEYFLGTSGKGYCTHFASAGTLLLRELGLPARYVVGYIVKPGKISYSEGEYKASVLDSDAHAWTEIYLENYGWVPVEMTPGYQDSRNQSNQNVVLIPSADVIPPTQTDLEEETPSTEAEWIEKEENNPTLEEEEQPLDDKQEVPEESEESSSSGKGEDGTSGTEAVLEGEKDGRILKSGKVVPIVLLLAIAVLVCYGYRAGSRSRGERYLNTYLRRGDHKGPVKWMHNEIYRILVEKERKCSGIRDKELLIALKREFPEIEEGNWDTYFKIVRRAVYSKEQITKAEVAECYKIYKNLREMNKKY